MKFAVMTHIALPEGKDPKQRLDELSEEVQYAEALGFSSAWHAEQHFTRFGIGSSALVVASHLAARTSTIRLGTSVMVPPLHHPIRLAEDTATMDLLRGDAWMWAMAGAVGILAMKALTYPGNRAWNDSRRLSPSCRTSGPRVTIPTRNPFKVSGSTWSLHPPKPPPPRFISAPPPSTMEFFVVLGLSPLSGGCCGLPPPPWSVAAFQHAPRRPQHSSPLPPPSPPFFFFSSPPTQATRPAEQCWEGVCALPPPPFFQGGGVSLEAWRQTLTQPTVDLDHVYEHRAFIGTPDQCIANIQRLQEQGIDYFGCNFAFSRMEHDKVMRAMQLFATEVMPHFI